MAKPIERDTPATRAMRAFDAAKTALAKVSRIDELMQVRDQATALRAYYRQARESSEMMNNCGRIKLRAVRRIGERLKSVIPHQGGRPSSRKPSQTASVSEDGAEVAPTLAELGINASQSSRYQSIASIPEPVFENYLDPERADNVEEITTAGLLRAAKKAGVTTAMFSSESEEWYTPRRYLDCAREVLGGTIELDPASCEKANRVVKAKRFYNATQDGLRQSWKAKSLWLNPPYGSAGEGRSNQDTWTKRLLEEYSRGRVGQAMTLVNAATASTWFARLWDHSIRFVGHRIRFETPEGKPGPSPTHASVIVYLGPHPELFAERFSPLGRVVFPGELREGVGVSLSYRASKDMAK